MIVRITRIRRGERKASLTLRLMWTRMRYIGPTFVGVFVSCSLLLYLVEHDAKPEHFAKVSDAFWFCVVTMATVGYGDLYPITTLGRIITAIFILFTLGTLGLLITTINEAVMEVKKLDEGGYIGTTMKGHVIVCGFNSMARAALMELLAAGRKTALLCETAEELETARHTDRLAGELFATTGEPTQELLRDRLNAAHCEAVIVAMSDDAKNLIAALNVKVVNPGARLVVALQREELRQTLQAGGVTYIASPNELSGRMVASAAFEPEVATLLEDLMSGAIGDTDMQQYTAGPLGGRPVSGVRAKLAEIDGPLLVAIAKPDGNGFRVIPNPKATVEVTPADQLLVMADDASARRLTAKYNLRQGR